MWLISLYWATTTLTSVGFGDIIPGNNIEWTVTILVEIAGSLFAVSPIFSAMHTTP
jgi:hypothetical protein